LEQTQQLLFRYTLDDAHAPSMFRNDLQWRVKSAHDEEKEVAEAINQQQNV
jgi:hypothetical protein